MKPTKNRFFCPSAQRLKMVFASKEKAENFLFFNQEQIAVQHSFVPVRAYYCPSCGGWHVTHTSLRSEYVERDNQAEAAAFLVKFFETLESKFRSHEWEEWSERMEVAKGLMDMLREQSEHYLLVRSKERMFSHYAELIERERNKAVLSANPSYMEHLLELQQSIFYRLSKGCFEGVPALGRELRGMLDDPLADCLFPGKRTRFGTLANWLTDTGSLPLFERGYVLLERLNGLPDMEPSDLKNTVEELRQVVDEMGQLSVCNELITPLKNGLGKHLRRLKN